MRTLAPGRGAERPTAPKGALPGPAAESARGGGGARAAADIRSPESGGQQRGSSRTTSQIGACFRYNKKEGENGRFVWSVLWRGGGHKKAEAENPKQ